MLLGFQYSFYPVGLTFIIKEKTLLSRNISTMEKNCPKTNYWIF